MLENLVEQPEGPAVHVLGADNVIAGSQQLHDGVEAAHPAGEREPMKPVLERGDVPLECFACWVFPTCVLVPLVLSQALLHVRGREVDRRHDRAGEGLGSLAGVDGPRAESGDQVLIKYARHADTRSLGVREEVNRPSDAS